MLDSFISLFSDYGYIAVFGVLLLCGFGLPLPEDVTLVAGGVMTGLSCPESIDLLTSMKDCPRIHLLVLVSMTGVLLGDLIMMTIGRLLGEHITQIRWYRRLLSESRMAAIEERFQKWGVWIVFVARFMPGLRSPIFVVTGMTRKVTYLRFILTDGAAAVISVPLWVYLGFLGAQNRTALGHWIRTGQTTSITIVGVILVVVILVNHLRRRRASS